MAAFNKKAHLRQNIDAIKVAFELETTGSEATPEQIEILQGYSGFGAIKEVLDPLPASDNKANENPLTPLIRELHEVLRGETAGEKEYKHYADGVKNSVLSAFYTPPVIADTIAGALKRNGVTPGRVLDPSAGSGAFGDSIKRIAPDAEITSFEKDPATGLILKHLRPEDHVRVQGYETIEPKYNGYYNVAASNIPFGDVALFDPAFSTSAEPARRQGARTLHNYFFMKSVDTVREGGIIAFITSQGVLNSERNRPVREWLMERCDLVSAIRLPNNLFTDHAGTEVGSDLIVLQKRPTGGQALTQRQKDFIETETISGISTSKLFNPSHTERIVANGYKKDTDPYGKPGFVYTYRGGNSGISDMEGIAKELGRMLSDDIYRHLDLERYHLNAPQVPEQSQAKTQTVAPKQTEPIPGDLDPFWQAIEDHFENNRPETIAEEVKPERPARQVDIIQGRNGAEIEVVSYNHRQAESQQPQPEPPIPDDPFWKATPEDWQRFNNWFAAGEARMKAAAEGFHLDTETGELTPLADMQQNIQQSPEIQPEPAGDYQPTAEDWAEVGALADESRRRFEEEHPPMPHHYGITEPQEVTETVAAQQTSPQPEAVETATTEPQVSAAPGSFAGSLFDMDDPAIMRRPPAEQQPELNVQQEPLITLYDLFGFSQEERSQVNRPRRRKKKPAKSKKDAEQRVLDWREELMLERDERQQGRQEQAVPTTTPVQPNTSQATVPTETNEDPNKWQKMYEEYKAVVEEKYRGQVYPIHDARAETHLENLRKLAEEEQRLQQEEQQREREEYLKPVPFKNEMLPHYREGVLVADAGNRIGYLRNIDGLQPMFHPLELTETQEKKASIYVEIRDTYYHLYQNEAERLEANPALRDMLNRLYDNFTERFGLLNDKKNLDLIKMDARGTEILALERYIDGVAQKADIFNHPVAFNPNELTEAADGREALVASLNKYAAVNLDYMAGLTGGTKDELLDELQGSIYFNPDIEGYEVADKYISGNVIQKAERVERFLKDNPGHAAAQESLAALQEATPKPIAFDDLDFNFGERWIPHGVYERYASWLFDTDVSITFAPNIDEYGVKAADKSGPKIQDQYAVDSQSRKFNGLHLLKHALHNTTPDITKKVNKLIDGKMQEVKVRDGEKIQLANSKIDEIRDGFSDWLREQSPEFKDRLTDMYNRKFNCFVRPQYDGSHQSFPGLDLKGLGIPDLYKSQKDAIWMDKLQGGGICDHEVGGGKTLIMCVGAMEKKRLGLANKPMITGLKANIHEIARTFCTAYPNARVLYPGKEDFTPANRERIFREIKNNDWDAVILTHEQFGKIPQSPELQQEILQTELDSVEENLAVLKAQGKSVSRAMLKGCVRRKLNLEAKLLAAQHAIDSRKDNAVDFKLMGIDHLYVDESHKFKNLTFNTRHDRVAGLGNPEGSARALNMLYAIRTIQERTGRDLGATFLSGTTISNSLTELYLLFKYLRPQEMERLNMKTFDAWAAVFAKKTTDYEFSVTNEVVQKERFRYFIKVPELAQLYAEITDFRTAADIGIDRPEKNEVLYTIPPTADQRDFIDRLVKFAKTGDGELLYRGKLTENEDKAKMLLATNYSRKMSLDMRMIDPDRFGDDVDNKASHAARNIAKYYRDYDQHKGTQFVFSDLGTYKPGEWNIYSEIKRKLVEDYGVKPHEVRFIQEATSEKMRKDMIAQMNEGKIRVLFGSTEMLGTGVNAQKRCVAIHHLDQPWRPSDLNQRDGRGIRTGNEVAKYYADNKVDVVLYAVEKTLDAYIFNLLHNKQLFIQQLKTGSMGARTIDEGSVDEKSGMNFSEYVAILSGNTELLEKARLEKKITTLESERQSFVRGKSSSRYKLDDILQKVEKNDGLIERIGKDLANFKSRVQENEDGSYKNPIQIDGIQGGDIKLIGKQLNHIAETARTGVEPEKIGSLYGFDIVVKSERTEKEGLDLVQNRFYVRGEGDYLYQYNFGNLAADPRTAAQNPINALGTIEPVLEKFQKENEKLSKDIPVLREVVESTWRKEPELAALKSELTVLDRKIQLSLKPVEDSEGEVLETPKEAPKQAPADNRQQTPPGASGQPYVPSRLREIAAGSGGRVVIGSVGSNIPDRDNVSKIKL